MFIEDNKSYIMINAHKKKKNLFLNSILYILLLSFLWILFSFNSLNNDRGNYQALYYYVNEIDSFDTGIEIGFQVCMKIIGKLGLTYEKFQIIVASVFLIVISLFIKKYALNSFYCLFLYFVFPFTLDTIQLRNSISYAIILFALINLYKAKITSYKAGYICKFIFFTLIATLFHKVAFIYLIFLIILFDEKKIKEIVYIFFTIELLIIFFSPSYINFMGKLIPKIQLYLDMNLFSTKLSTKFLLLILVIAIPTIYKALITISHARRDSFIQFCYLISWISGILYIFYIIDVDFFRIYRNLFLILYVGIENMIERIINRQKRIFYQIMLLCVSILFCIFFISYQSDNISNLFLNNYLLCR